MFAPVFFVFLFATILMVGDGTAPAVTHLSANLIGFTVKLLGLSFEGAIVPAVLFWSLVVFGVGFLYAFVTTTNRPIPQSRKAGYWPIVVLAVVVMAVILLVQNHQSEAASVREKALALEFVRNNSEVMQMVGGQGRVNLATTRKSRGKPTIYDIGVYGTNRLYAIVEATSGNPVPVFRLVCVTPISMGGRDPFKHPCEQK